MARPKKKNPKYAKGWETRRLRAAERAHGLPANVKVATNSLTATGRQAFALGLLNTETKSSPAVGYQIPGRGEIVGGADAAMADEIMKLAKQKNGTGAMDAVQALITNYGQLRENLGASQQRLDASKQKRSIIAEYDRRIVCGFLSEVYDVQQRDGEIPDAMIWTLNSFTVSRIVDALNRAGYFPAGQRRGLDNAASGQSAN